MYFWPDVSILINTFLLTIRIQPLERLDYFPNFSCSFAATTSSAKKKSGATRFRSILMPSRGFEAKPSSQGRMWHRSHKERRHIATHTSEEWTRTASTSPSSATTLLPEMRLPQSRNPLSTTLIAGGVEVATTTESCLPYHLVLAGRKRDRQHHWSGYRRLYAEPYRGRPMAEFDGVQSPDGEVAKLKLYPRFPEKETKGSSERRSS